MSQRNVRFHPAAVEEAEAAYRWYLERSPTAAQAFLRDLELTIERVRESPERWPHFNRHTRRYIFPRFPFSLVYRFRTSTVIEVIAVAHGKRKPGYWRKR